MFCFTPSLQFIYSPANIFVIKCRHFWKRPIHIKLAHLTILSTFVHVLISAIDQLISTSSSKRGSIYRVFCMPLKVKIH